MISRKNMMTKSKQTRQQPTNPANHRRRLRLLGGIVVTLLLLTAAAMLFAPRLLVSPSIKQKIQTAIAESTGGRLDYQDIDICYFPRPGIELLGVSLALPEQVQAQITSLRISPRLFPLLKGDLQLSALELHTPQLSLTLPDAKPDKIPAQPWTPTVLQEHLTKAVAAVGPMLSRINIAISDAQVTMTRNGQKMVTIAGMSLQGSMTVTNLNTAEAGLKTKIDELNIFHRDRRETLQNISLSGSIRKTADGMTATIKYLDLDRPSLQLTGEFICTPTEPNFMLNLSGINIDVDASRAAALALAGDTPPVKEIFDYLRGGRVPRISFTSHGDTVSELGELDNILIKGQLQGGKVSIPEIKLELNEVAGDVVINHGILQGTGLSTRLKNSAGQDGSLQIGLAEDNDLFQLELALSADLAEVYPWLASLGGLRDHLQKVKQVSGRIDMSTLKLQGPLNKPSTWKIFSSGTLNKLSFETELFPDTIHIASGEFAINPQQLSFKKLNAGSQDTALTLSGTVKGMPLQFDRLDLLLDGRMGTQSFKWLSAQFKLPDAYTIHTPFDIRESKISWQPDSTTATASFKGSIEIENGPAVTADVDYSPNRLNLQQLTVKDQYSDAVMVFDRTKDRRAYKFTGSLRHETLQTLFVDTAFKSGRLEGDLAVSVPPAGQAAVTVKGQLTGDNLPLVLPSGDRVDIDHAALQGAGSEIKIDITGLTWEDLHWTPVRATVSFKDNSTDIQFNEARLCGIDSPGTISTTGNRLSVDMALTGRNLDVATSYNCLTNGRVKMTGKLDFTSKITAAGQVDRLVKGMRGPLKMTFRNGVIQQDKILSRILEVLNVTEIIKGRLPNLTSNGFAYKTMTVQGRFQNGKLTIDKYHMDGETLDLLGKGEVDLEKRTVAMQLLAAPFQTVNTIVKHVPGVNYLLAGSLISIPVSISGSLTDPQVNVLSVSAVSSSLFDLAKRTIESPFRLLDALNPWSKKKD